MRSINRALVQKLSPRRLIVLLGLSPGVLHSVLCAWRRILSDETSITVIATREDVVRRAVELASRCLCPGVGEPPLTDPESVEVKLFKRGDVDSLEALAEFRRMLESLRLAPSDAIDVTGGRKLASIAAAVYAASVGAMIGYTWIPSDEYSRISRRGVEGGCEVETVRVEPLLILLS